MIGRSLKIGMAGLLPVLCPAQGFRYFDVSDPSQYPRLLSETGLYRDIAGKVMIPEAVKFEINSPLWSDGALKSRWILLKPGQSVAFRERDDYWGYPDSAVFIKQFAIDTIPGDTASRRLWETRLLINKRQTIDSLGTVIDFWYGLSYQWNASQTDAELVSQEEGRKDKIRVYPEGKDRPPVWKKWAFPAAWECNICHFQHYTAAHDFADGQSRTVLGFFTSQLNRPSSLTPGINQLEDFFRKGILRGIKPDNWDAAPRWYALSDPGKSGSRAGSLDGRVRAYLAANCSGCHGDRGIRFGATMDHDVNFDFHTLEPRTILENWVPHWPGEDSLEPKNVPRGLLVPGYPEKSFLLVRQLARNTRPDDFSWDELQMPFLGSFEVDRVATDSIRKWIVEYEPATSVQPRAERGKVSPPILQGRRVFLSPETLGAGNPKVALRGLSGREWTLTPAGKGTFAIPPGLSPGVYILKAGSRSFILSLL